MSTIGKKNEALYLGVDVGGTKIQASLVGSSGAILTRSRQRTPRMDDADALLAAIEQAMRDALEVGKQRIKPSRLRAIGIAIPGVVDPDFGLVVVAPNLGLRNVEVGPRIEEAFTTPVYLGNDCNLGTLGEKWLGSARGASSVVGILVGTGIGAGIVQGTRLWRGARESAGEIGHIVMQIGGPPCACGNRGCFEALASRTAIERDLRDAVAAGRQTVLTNMLGGDLSVIRSGQLRQALKVGDALVSEVLAHAAEVLGYACLTVRHLVDPEVIVLGGGVLEACGEFMMPIVERVVASDKLPGAQKDGAGSWAAVLRSKLGDDAVVLGAVALAQMEGGANPLKKPPAATQAPKIAKLRRGKITIGKTTYARDVCIRVDGRVRKWKNGIGAQPDGKAYAIGRGEVAKACKGAPEILFVGCGSSQKIQLSPRAEQFLERRAIQHEILPSPQAIDAFNRSNKRKVALIRIG